MIETTSSSSFETSDEEREERERATTGTSAQVKEIEDETGAKKSAAEKVVDENGVSDVESVGKLAPPFRTPEGDIVPGESETAPVEGIILETENAVDEFGKLNLLEPWVFELPGQEEVAAIDAVEAMDI